MHNKEFYAGILHELEKRALLTGAAAIPGMKTLKNVGSRLSSGVSRLGGAVKDITSAPSMGQAAGRTLGHIDNTLSRGGQYLHPGTGIMPAIHNYTHNKLDTGVDNAAKNFNIFSPSVGAQTAANQVPEAAKGFLSSSRDALGYLNSNQSELGKKTWGTTTYDPNANKFNTDISKVDPGLAAQGIGGWLKDNWKPVAGVLGGGLVLSALMNHGSQTPAPPQPPAAPLPPGNQQNLRVDTVHNGQTQFL